MIELDWTSDICSNFGIRCSLRNHPKEFDSSSEYKGWTDESTRKSTTTSKIKSLVEQYGNTKE